MGETALDPRLDPRELMTDAEVVGTPNGPRMRTHVHTASISDEAVEKIANRTADIIMQRINAAMKQ